MRIHDIHIRDPFVLAAEGRYYLYGSRGSECWGHCTGFDVFISNDLEEWEGPYPVFNPPAGFWSDWQFWAPEVHCYQGRYYMFASFKSEHRCRGTQILASDSPAGPFLPHSNGPVTPADWECLDGTLYVNDDGTPYIIFCHEWVQVKDGEMCAMPLSRDLRQPEGKPFLLFRASQPFWALPNADQYVTDGPFVWRTAAGELRLIWSSFTEKGYVEAVSHPEDNDITHPWHHDPLLFDHDGGHGMIFRRYDGDLAFIMHSPNETPYERPVIKRLIERNGVLMVAQ